MRFVKSFRWPEWAGASIADMANGEAKMPGGA
jgi:hypothetical protein